MNIDPPVVRQPGPRRATSRRCGGHLRLAIGIEGVVNGKDDAKLLVIVGNGSLQAPEQGVDPGRLRSPCASSRDVTIANDPTQLDQRGVFIEPEASDDDLSPYFF